MFANIFNASVWLSILGRDTAYLDPGSGSFILQLIIAGIVGAGFVLRGYWSKVVAFFKGSSGEEDDDLDDVGDA
jgi:hypothetical protein